MFFYHSCINPFPTLINKLEVIKVIHACLETGRKRMYQIGGNFEIHFVLNLSGAFPLPLSMHQCVLSTYLNNIFDDR